MARNRGEGGREERIYAVLTAAAVLVGIGLALYGVHRYLVWVVSSACRMGGA